MRPLRRALDGRPLGRRSRPTSVDDAPDGVVAFEVHVTRRGRRLRERAVRTRLVSVVLGGYGLQFQDWEGSSYILRDRKGNSAIVHDLAQLWTAAERMIGRSARPARSRFPRRPARPVEARGMRQEARRRGTEGGGRRDVNVLLLDLLASSPPRLLDSSLPPMIPILIVSGFLGSGKTTLIRAILSDPRPARSPSSSTSSARSGSTITCYARPTSGPRCSATAASAARCATTWPRRCAICSASASAARSPVSTACHRNDRAGRSRRRSCTPSSTSRSFATTSASSGSSTTLDAVNGARIWRPTARRCGRSPPPTSRSSPSAIWPRRRMRRRHSSELSGGSTPPRARRRQLRQHRSRTAC